MSNHKILGHIQLKSTRTAHLGIQRIFGMTLRTYVNQNFLSIFIQSCIPYKSWNHLDILYRIQDSSYPQVLLLTIGYKFRREESN
jgi:hypothetical protein